MRMIELGEEEEELKERLYKFLGVELELS